MPTSPFSPFGHQAVTTLAAGTRVKPLLRGIMGGASKPSQCGLCGSTIGLCESSEPSTFGKPKNKTHRIRKPGRCALSRAYCLASSSSACGCRSFEWPAWPLRGRNVSEPVQDLVGPEPLEAVQRLVQRREFLVGDAADLLHRLDVLLVERV